MHSIIWISENREICSMYENSKSQLFIEIYVQLIQLRLSF